MALEDPGWNGEGLVGDDNSNINKNSNSNNSGSSAGDSTQQLEENELSRVPTLASGDDGDDNANAADDDDGGDYDPESITTSLPVAAPAAPAAPASPAAPVAVPVASKPQPKRPKITSGFLVESSDDEDEEDNQGQAAAAAGLGAPGQVPAPAPALDPAPAPVPSRSSHSPSAPAAATAATAFAAVSVAAVPEQQQQQQQQQVVDGDSGVSPPPPGGEQVLSVPADLKSPLLANHTTTTTMRPPPQDPAALLQSRIQEDPRGDMDAWLALIAEHRRHDKLDRTRAVYHRFLEVFPQASDIWIEWIDLELAHDNFMEAEQLFGRSLMTVPNVHLWTVYLNYIRRRNDLNNDPNGQARRTVTQAYEFVIDNIGLDKDSGQIWLDYVAFIRNGPGNVGGSNWQDQQKMDQLRKAYQRAISVPTTAINTLWREYDQFEMGLNKMTGRKFIQERSPSYMSAKSANIALDNITRNLSRNTIPRLQPAQGFAGYDDYMEQTRLWTRWIDWEMDDPLVLKSDEPAVYRQRILYCYKQALMSLRFWPPLWARAADWCLQEKGLKDGRETGLNFLLHGVDANPESVLLALKHGHYIEQSHPDGEDDDSRAARAAAVRQPYDKVLNTLYAMALSTKEKEKAEVDRIEAVSGPGSPAHSNNNEDDDDDDEYNYNSNNRGGGGSREAQMTALRQMFSAQIAVLSKTISYVWIALARAMRRIQGKGSVSKGGPVKGTGLRQIFTDARQRGRLTSDVYVAVALIESNVYKDPVGAKIFERGAKLFPDDEEFMLEYIKFLHSKDDTTNARVLFEQCVNRLIQNPATVFKAKPLYAYIHQYESRYGELSQIVKLEERMEELFPDDPNLSHFASRFTTQHFDPINTRIIVSPAVQMRPGGPGGGLAPPAAAPTAPAAFPAEDSLPWTRDDSPVPMRGRRDRDPSPSRARFANMHSPKRSYPIDDDQDFNHRPHKLARGESPLKGAAGRRLDQQRRNQASALHLDITFLLSQIPASRHYDFLRFSPHKVISLLRDMPIPDYRTWQAGQTEAGARAGHHQSSGSGGDYSGGYGGGRIESPNANANSQPGSQQQPRSPYESNNQGLGQNQPPRLVSAAAAYRGSSLRLDGTYEQPPMGGHFAPAIEAAPTSWPGGYGVPPPPGPGQYGSRAGW